MEKFWLKRGRQVALRVNAARWLGFTAPAVAGLGVAAGCAVLIARRNEWNLASVTAISSVLLLVIGWIGWRQARRNWFTGADGLVRLEAMLNLRNRLSSAAQGVGSWPAVPETPERLDDHFRWRWTRLLLPPLLGVAFLAAAALFPISRDFASPPKVEQPLAWEQIAAALDDLKQENAADPDAIEAMEQKLDALRSQPLEAWYSQGSLEAGDALRHEAANAIAALERHLEAAAQTLSRHQNSPQSLDASATAAQWKDVMQGLESGALPLGKTELGKLREFNPASAGQLSPEQLQKMQEALSRKANASQAALGKVSDALAEMQARMRQAKGNRPGAPGNEPGDPEGEGASGQPGPGGGHDPLGLKNAPVTLNPEKLEALEGSGPERTAPGDLLSLSASEHKVDPAEYRGPSAGGSASAGAGGEAVWKNELPPAEREVLRRFFK